MNLADLPMPLRVLFVACRRYAAGYGPVQDAQRATSVAYDAGYDTPEIDRVSRAGLRAGRMMRREVSA